MSDEASSRGVARPIGPDRRSIGQMMDRVGLALAASIIVWVVLFAGAAGGDRPAPLVALVIGFVIAVALGRRLTRWHRLAVPAIVAVGIAIALLTAGQGLRGSAGAPLGYANANATFAALGAFAALGGAACAPPIRSGPPDRVVWLILSGLLAIGALIPNSAAGSLSLVVGLVLVGVALWLRQVWIAVLGGAAVVAMMLALTGVIALGGDPAGLGERSGVRGELWELAIDLTQEHPWRGVGPGTFAAHNPLGEDPDLQWVHHGYLQVAAELGLPGLGLSLAALGWLYARLWIMSSVQAGAAATVAGAVTVVALHATVDYVWHFPQVLLTLAILVGWATADP